MAESKDEDSKMEEDWEYYDDNNVLTDFWQVNIYQDRIICFKRKKIFRLL